MIDVEITFKKGRTQQLKNFIDGLKANDKLKAVVESVKFGL